MKSIGTMLAAPLLGVLAVSAALAVFATISACSDEREEFSWGMDGCFLFRAKIENEASSTRAVRDSATTVFSRDTLYCADKDVYVTADVDQLGANAVATRGVPIVSDAQLPSLKVHMMNTNTDTWASGRSRTLERELSVANASGGDFNYGTPIAFVKDGKNRTFIAFSPIENANNNGLTKKSGTVLTYAVPADVTKHPDLCSSVLAGNIDIQNSGGGEHIRDFALQHELTAIGFALRGSGVKILSATIKGVKTVGDFDLATKTWALANNADARAAGINQQFYNVGWTESWVNCTLANGYLMMIPQTLTDAAQLTIVYQYNYGENKGKNLTLVSNLRKLTGGVWTAGKRISYNIRFKADPSVTADDLLIDCSLAGYTTETPIHVANTSTDDVLTFTWDAAWLKIHQGSPKENNTSGGATSGWSAPANKQLNNIYFFATGDNPSTMTRTATVTVRGKKSLERTFKVTQKAKPTLSVDKTFINIADYKGDLCYRPGTLNVISFASSSPKDVTVTSDVGWLRASINYATQQIPFDYQWDLNGGYDWANRHIRIVDLSVKVSEKGKVVSQEDITIVQHGNYDGYWLMIGNPKDLWYNKEVRENYAVEAMDVGAYTTGSMGEIKKWCHNNGHHETGGNHLFPPWIWEKILNDYVFPGLWERRGNLNQSRYWTDDYDLGFWFDLGKAINIDWNKKTYWYSTPKENNLIEHRCMTWITL